MGAADNNFYAIGMACFGKKSYFRSQNKKRN
jgi:hypothetical protein